MLQHAFQDLAVVERAGDVATAQHRNLGDVVVLDQRQRLAQRIAALHRQQSAHRPPLAGQHVGDPRHCGIEEMVVAHPGVVVDLAEIALAGVRQQHHHQLTRRERARDLERHPHRHARRATDEDRLLARQPAGHAEPVAVPAGDHLVDHREVRGARDEVLAHAFDLVRVRLRDLVRVVIVLEDRAHRIGADHAHGGVLLLEVAAGARNGAAGAHAGNEVGDAAGGLLPELGTRRAVVGLGIRRVVILVHQHRAGALLGDAARHRVVGLGRVGRHRGRTQHDLGPEGLEQAHLLQRHLVGHAEHRSIAAHGRHHREPHAGVARGALDDRAAPLEPAVALRSLHHGESDAVLHAAAGIEVLELGQDRRGAVARHFSQPNERRVADRLQHRFVVAHAGQAGVGRHRGVPLGDQMIRAARLAGRPRCFQAPGGA